MTKLFFIPLNAPKSNSELSHQAHEFLRYIAKQRLGISDEQFILAKNEYGKPYLARHPNFYFNISHTQNAIAIAISYTEIGVDIERLRDPNQKIAHRFFTPNEVAYIETRNNAECFLEIWTKKEAYIKWQGKGLTIPLNSFDVLETPNLFQTWHMGEYIISVCQENLPQKIQLQQWTKEIIR